MRYLFKIVLFSSLLFSLLLSNTDIDECKNDLYYANGIMIKDSKQKVKNTWDKEIENMFANNQEAYNKLDKITISYNTSQDFFNDMFESLQQVMGNEWGWIEFSDYFRTYLELKGYQTSFDLHRPDLTAQVNAYKQSIKDGHGVIVIAHSQGNYYTNEAYEELDEWMKDYFHMFGVATPANHVAGYPVGDATAPYVKFHNDFINIVLTGLPSNRDDTRHHGFPSIDAHDFYESYLKEETTKSDIFNFILNKIQAHGNAPSQWETESEQDKNTKEYRITVKHKFDSSIIAMNGIEVYPFAPTKKLYQVNNEWVKASCGGTEILASWIDQKENEFYMINNPEKEKIFKVKNCHYQSLTIGVFSLWHHMDAVSLTYDRTGAMFYIDSNVDLDEYNLTVLLTAGNLYGPIVFSENWFFDYKVSALFDDYTPSGAVTLTATADFGECILKRTVTAVLKPYFN